MTSRRFIMIIPATAMAVCLGAYAISAGGGCSAINTSPAGRRTSASAGSTRTLAPMRAVTAGELDGKTADATAQKQQSFEDSLKKQDAEIIAKLGLSEAQMTRYAALQDRLAEETEIMHGLPSGHIQRGMEINQMLHKGLKEIFTPEQYQKYLDLWAAAGQKHKPVAKKTNAPKVDDPMAGGTPFAGTDEDVLNRIRPKLSKKQWQQYADFRVEMDAKNQEMYQLLRDGDTQAAGFMSGDINKANLAGMRKILTADQYQQWIDMWDEVMAPFMGNADPNARRELVASPADAGEQRPIAEKIGEDAPVGNP